MTNYQNGKIYKIEPLNGEEGDVYIGSTCKQYLSQRMDKHRSGYKSWKEGKVLTNVTSYILFEKYGVKNCNIVLIETSLCNTRDELFAREAFYIKSMKCVNKCIPLRTDKEWYDQNRDKILEQAKEYGKVYYENNREKKLEYQKIYSHSNQDKIIESGKKYYQENKDIISEKTRIYYQENKDKITERNKLYVANNVESTKKNKAKWFQDNKDIIKEKNEEITCECGSICRRNGISRHKKTIKHKEYEKSV
jgi:hypothetical protein